MSLVVNPVYWQSRIDIPTKLTSGGGGGYSAALGINTNGNIVGSIRNIVSNEIKPYYWSSYTASPISISLGSGSEGIAQGINTAGNIVGNIGPNPYYWSSYTDSSQTPIPIPSGSTGSANGINSFGHIIGSINDNPYYWSSYTDSSPTPIPIPSGSTVIAQGINTAGNIVGNIDNKPYYWSSYTDSSPTPIPIPSGSTGSANGINTAGNIVGSIDGNIYYWTSYTDSSPTPISIGSFIYCFVNGINDSGNIVGAVYANQPISNICFPAGTPVKTDKGIIPIEKIDKNIHTIQGQSILHITQTITLDSYLICFKSNSISRNVPNQTTIMSKDHKIEFNGRMVSAYRFLNFSKEVKKVKYNGEILYNVLLQNYGKMDINNLICETLHPENIIAKLYTTNYTDNNRQKIICQLNKYLTEGNLPMYKNIVNSIR